MTTSPFLPLPAHLTIQQVTVDTTAIHVSVIAINDTADCPVCMVTSSRVRSSYQRTVADLPCGGQRVTLHLRMRRFICRNPACPRQIFVEQVPTWLRPRARQTERRRDAIVVVGLATSGNQGARLASRLGMPTSRSTINRAIMRLDVSPSPAPTSVGIDDFALLRGHRYGTIVLDLVQHQVLDVLPDRSVMTTATWLRVHPSVTVVSRDRGGSYAEGVRQSGRAIIQIADRWHLLTNLGDAVERIAGRLHWGTLLATQQAHEDEGAHAPLAFPLVSPLPLSLRQQERREAILTLHEQGVSLNKIAAQLHVARATVRRYVGGYAEQRLRGVRSSLVDPFRPYIYERWQAGADAMPISREICEQGYQGKHSIVRHVVTTWRKAAPPRPPVRHLSPHQIRWLLVKATAKLSLQEREQRLRLLAASSDALTVFSLYHRFGAMMQQHQADRLGNWLAAADASGLTELRAFAAGIHRDMQAVVNGFCSPLSQGPVEGAITKLKLIKRQMYGKAGLPLLRQRLLHPA